MFTTLQNFFKALFGDIQKTFIWLFAIGALFTALMVWLGDEQSSPKFKKGLTVCLWGLVLFLIVKPMITYVAGKFGVTF
ncbi:hypothetical protein [Gottfriedia solisilvae]|uniref:hypothetical protein n=1 Tax=Gottfriedia solisilvae TaxID=1516104 RepID=UPI003D2F4CD8